MEKFGLSDRIRIAKESTATVALAAKAFDCEEKKIAKTLSFMLPSGPILVLAVGDARIDNAKFKHTFAAKAKMIKPEECEQIIGHAPGGVCPFGINVIWTNLLKVWIPYFRHAGLPIPALN